MQKILLVSFLIISSNTFSQNIHGTVYDDQGNLLPFSSILVKGTTQGSTANNQAKFNFNLSGGKYTLVCQHVGYSKQEKEITVNNNDVEI